MKNSSLLAVLFLVFILSFSAFAQEKVAAPEDTVAAEEVLEDWMEPIPVSDLQDGSYEVKVHCSSSMFKITSATLTVEGGEAKAILTMGGTGYLYVYPGTALEAAEASEEDYIPFEEKEEGVHTFTIPVKELDAITPCAAFSKRKELWYDRNLAFVSTSLPASAFVEAKGTAISELGLSDGTYLVDATLSGGSGRASIESPAKLFIKEGEASLQVVFSSPNYDYMLVEGTRYERVNTEGNSTFEIPVTAFDTQLPVIADTVAMSKPHEISYTIYLDGGSLQEAE
ncbi:MAG: hypothetical protein IIZ39_01155 [Blautia sp.]|nr:hypothetical protein [Blautia sp.]